METGKVRKIIGIAIAGIGVVVILIAAGKAIVTSAKNKAAAEEYASYAVISDEAGLQKAVNSSTTEKYVVENIPIKGTMIQDSDGVLKGEYTVIYKICEKYTRTSTGSSRNGRRRYTNTWKSYPSDSSFKVVSDASILSDTSVTFTRENSDGWMQISLRDDNCNKPNNIVNGMYYENKSSSPNIGDKRYTYYIVPANTTVSFVAEAGSGVLTVLPLSESDKMYLYSSNSAALIQYVSEGLTKKATDSSLITGFFGFFMILFGVISMLNKGRRVNVQGNRVNLAGGRQLKSDRYFNDDGTPKNENVQTNADMFENTSNAFGAKYTSEGSIKVKSDRYFNDDGTPNNDRYYNSDNGASGNNNRYFNDDGTPLNRNGSSTDMYGTSDSNRYFSEEDPPKKNDKDDDDKSMPSLFL